MDERGQKRIEKSKGSEPDSAGVHENRTREILGQMMCRDQRAIATVRTNFARSFPRSTLSALSRATSVPGPMATNRPRA